jgi:hypothetical protein
MIPNPSSYRKWELWGNQVQTVLTPFMSRIESTFFRQGRIPRLASFIAAELPSPQTPGEIIYVSDETSGAVIAFSDGTNWRRTTDRAIVS